MPARKIPTKIKRLHGDIHKERWNKKEPIPESAIPSCPDKLDGAAKYEWKRITKELFQLGILSRIDRADLAAYCSSYARWMECEDKIKELKTKNPDSLGVLYKTTNGNLIISPLLSVLKGEREACHKFLVEFGMTPASRTRINVEKKNDEDEFEKFLNSN